MAKINEFMTVGEAAELLGVSKDTLRRWDRAGKLKARRHPVSRYKPYLKSDLDQFLRQLGVAAEQSGRSSRAKKKGKRTRK